MEHLLARTLAAGSLPHQQDLHFIKEMVLDMAPTFLAATVSTGAYQCHQPIHVSCSTSTSLWKTGTLPFNWDAIFMMETCYSVPTKDFFHEDKEVVIPLFQMCEVADIALFQLCFRLCSAPTTVGL